jgi:lambda repressor-like predicted transcriptional regulator
MPKGIRKDAFPASALLKEFEQDTWASIIAEALGTRRSTVQRWRTSNTMLSPWQADEYAVRLGKHPSQIWPEWFPNPPTDTTKETE